MKEVPRLPLESKGRVHHLSLNQGRPFAASPQEHANPFQYQTSHGGGGEIHNQQADPDGEIVNSSPSNWMHSTPATVDIEAREFISISINSSPQGPPVNSTEESSDVESGSQTPPVDTENDNDGVNITLPDDDHKAKYELENALNVGGQIISIVAAVVAKNDNSEISGEAKYLWYGLLTCIFVSLISLFYGLFLSRFGRLPKAAWVVRATGFIATAYAIVVAAGLQLPNELMVMVTLGICALCAPAIVGLAIIG